MDMPTQDTPPEGYLPKSAYATGRVAADKKAAGLEAALLAVHDELKKTLRERDDLEEERQRKSAVLDARDGDCDADVENFELQLLGAVRKNREHPKYRRYFKTGLRDVTTAEPRKEEPEQVGQMLEAMAEDKNDPEIGEVVASWEPKLTASRANVVTADAALTETEKALDFLEEKRIPALMAAWREEYKKLEGALTTVYASNPKMVDRFFKPFRKRRKDTKKNESP
ncbi:hypothetical protein [Polyangium sp. 6x1]|uniref:hypothetical protein n=1 Tax=Polyangium sp. 6x1 TaxID=3042689 RepID=UPI002482E514|nr:hypothetical protein [Polyangium sp. 6x1]MDI1445659.1 hypothetical protein [Polyangium sp. 6x1]